LTVSKNQPIVLLTPPHCSGKGYQASSEKKMGMIRDEYPCITGSFFRLGQQFRKAFKKILAVLIIQEYLAMLYPPDHDVMQDTGSIKSSSSWHGRYLPHLFFLLNLFFYQR